MVLADRCRRNSVRKTILVEQCWLFLFRGTQKLGPRTNVGTPLGPRFVLSGDTLVPAITINAYCVNIFSVLSLSQ